jgi:antitoxin (DNA-binding transcriptional repressor) of toxin-antitoxin stability system
MAEVGIRELKQNASRVIARASSGERITVTDRGRPVAQISALSGSAVADLIASGEARPARRPLAELPPPTVVADASSALRELREAERY